MRPVLPYPSTRPGLSLILGMILVGPGGSAAASGLDDLVRQDMVFDQQYSSQLNIAMANNYAQQQQLMQSYVQAYGPQLQEQYQRSLQTGGARISFEQFVHYHMMAAGGGDAGPAMQRQHASFEALQQAQRSLGQGYDGNGWGRWDGWADSGGNGYYGASAGAAYPHPAGQYHPSDPAWPDPQPLPAEP